LTIQFQYYTFVINSQFKILDMTKIKTVSQKQKKCDANFEVLEKYYSKIASKKKGKLHKAVADTVNKVMDTNYTRTVAPSSIRKYYTAPQQLPFAENANKANLLLSTMIELMFAFIEKDSLDIIKVQTNLLNEIKQWKNQQFAQFATSTTPISSTGS